MALYAFDGTGNKDGSNNNKDSHIVRICEVYGSGKKYYRSGVGTQGGVIETVLGKLTGAGGREIIDDMMKDLGKELESDPIVDIIGFSRGAAMAIHFVNLLHKKGIKVRFLGLFDTVGSFGIPGNDIDLGWKTSRIPRTVKYCAHALAYDERRHNFLLTRPKCVSAEETFLIEIWFRGVHSDIGGTTIAKDAVANAKKSRTAITLSWMLEQAMAAGVSIAPEILADVQRRIRPLSQIGVNKDPVREPRDVTRTPKTGDLFHNTAKITEMSLGETRHIRCFSRVPFNPSGIMLKKDHTYQFSVDPGQMWEDEDITVNADGWRTEDHAKGIKEIGLEFSERLRRAKKQNWFKLIGSIGDIDDKAGTKKKKRTWFAIGTQLDNFQAKYEGELFTYANDLKQYGLLDLYSNNRGWVDIQVTRVI